MNDAVDSKRLIEMGREALRIEARAVAALVDRLGTDFEQACHILLACAGRVVVSGMGKSGHIGGKIAATLASTGTPASNSACGAAGGRLSATDSGPPERIIPRGSKARTSSPSTSHGRISQ